MSINFPSRCAENKPNDIVPTKKSTRDTFLKNLPTNTSLALFTVPAECLAVRRILTLLGDHPKIPYLSVIKSLGIQKLFSGSISRLSYFLTGNFATLQGIEYFGSDSRGLFLTSVVKNIILPLSLLANARQSCLPWSKTAPFIVKSSLDPTCHASFFLRNLISNSCLLPGFMARDHYYHVIGKSDTTIPNLLGLTISGITSALMNTFLKPFFTGKYPLKNRCAIAIKFPALIPLLFRETASMTLVFANSSPRE